jgi:hypothetical protein
MNKTLIALILFAVVLSWNFVFTDSKKLDLTDAAKVLQGLSTAIKYKIAVKEYWQEKGVLPDVGDWQKSGKKIDIDFSKSLVKNIDVGVDGPGAITVYFINKDVVNIAADINGKKIILKPSVKNDKLDWSCSGNLSRDLLPKACQ